MPDTDTALFPTSPVFPERPPTEIVEVYQQAEIALDILRVLRRIDPYSLMTDERFWEIVSQPTVIRHKWLHRITPRVGY